MACLVKVLSFFTLTSSLVYAQHHGYIHSYPNHYHSRRQNVVPINETASASTSQAYVVALKDGVTYQPNILDQIVQATGASAVLTEDLTGGVLFNGIIIQLGAHNGSIDAISQIKLLEDVVSVVPNQQIAVPKLNITSIIEGPRGNGSARQNLRTMIATSKQDYSNDQVMTQIDLLREKGYTGSGIKMAVIDGEADLNHPAQNIAYTRDFRRADDTPDADKNCGSHGLATSSVITTKPVENVPGEWRGIAPGVELGNYIVAGCKYGIGNVIQALEQAAVDKVQIISMSLAFGDNWAFSNLVAEAKVYNKLQALGILVVVGSDNTGNKGLYRTPFSCNSPAVLCAGYIENTGRETSWYNGSAITVNDGASMKDLKWRRGYTGAVDSTEFARVKLPLWTHPAGQPEDEHGCAIYPANTPDLSKHILLVRRHNRCGLDVDLLAVAEAHGAKYVLVSHENNSTYIEQVRVTAPNITAVAFISGLQADELMALMNSGKTLTIDMGKPHPSYYSVLKSYAGQELKELKMDRGSSWGPSWEGAVTVDIAAPGTEMPILVPYGKYGFAGGSSMAAPATAAAVALVAEAMGTTDMLLAASALTSTAKIVGAEGPANLASVASQGAGMVQADRAASAPAIITTRNIEFNQTSYRTTKTFEIVNRKNAAITFKLSNTPADTVYTFAVNSSVPAESYDQIRDTLYVQNADASLSFPGGNSVTVPANGKATVQVSATDPANADAARIPIWSGWVVLEAADGFNLSVPYLGIKGELDRAPKAWELEIRNSGRDFVFPDVGTVDVWVRIGMGSRSISTYIHRADGTRVGTAPWVKWPYTDRVTPGTGWRGDVPGGGGNVPNGEYFFRTESLRAFHPDGAATKPEDFVLMDSEKFRVTWK